MEAPTENMPYINLIKNAILHLLSPKTGHLHITQDFLTTRHLDTLIASHDYRDHKVDQVEIALMGPPWFYPVFGFWLEKHEKLGFGWIFVENTNRKTGSHPYLSPLLRSHFAQQSLRVNKGKHCERDPHPKLRPRAPNSLAL